YQERLAENRALDFDDLLMTTHRLFRERADILERYQDRYLHVLVDEFQDTNVAQYVLVKQLGGRHRNVCVVGDEDQSIYGWRKADIRNILNFEVDFPEARTVVLDQNYRSTKTILSAARGVIAVNNLRKDKTLWTDNDQGVPIRVFEAYNEDEEAGFVASEIERLVASGEVRLRDIAIMFRTNAQSRPVEQVLVRRRVPHRVIGTRFYDRKEIKDVMAYLRLLMNPDDDLSLLRVINTPPRGIGAKTLAELQRWARGKRMSLFNTLRQMRGDDGDASSGGGPRLASRAENALMDFLRTIEHLMNARDELPMVELLEFVLTHSGYGDFLRDGTEEGEERWGNVKELATVALAFDEFPPPEGLSSFLEETALVSDVDSLDGDSDAVTLITLHAAKGLEFSTVFLIGLEEGICPHSRSFDNPDQMEEERRLCYVGITRAMSRLYLVHAFHRTLYGNTIASVPSRFIDDIPRELTRGRDAPARSPAGLSQRLGSIASSPTLRPDARPAGPPSTAPIRKRTTKTTFQTGDRVRHARFGEGIVVSSRIARDDEEVDIAFPNVGVKKLLLSYAALERL
ncbi:MAG TPA: 3'-5' exonuclease, partial [Chloroflexota bacterium]|nr:3'-5' exonuclease [Chloroflexota bacterium]